MSELSAKALAVLADSKEISKEERAQARYLFERIKAPRVLS